MKIITKKLTDKHMVLVHLKLVLNHYLEIRQHLLHCKHEFASLVVLVVLTTNQMIVHLVTGVQLDDP